MCSIEDNRRYWANVYFSMYGLSRPTKASSYRGCDLSFPSYFCFAEPSVSSVNGV